MLIWNLRRRTSLTFVSHDSLSCGWKCVQWISASLCNSPRYCSCRQLSQVGRVFIARRSQILPYRLVSHEIQANLVRLACARLMNTVDTYIRGDTSHCRQYTSVQCKEAPLSLVHQDKRCPHAGKILSLDLAQCRKRGRLNGETSPHYVERICEGDGGDACQRPTY